jgi:hypothetical protein
MALPYNRPSERFIPRRLDQPEEPKWHLKFVDPLSLDDPIDIKDCLRAKLMFFGQQCATLMYEAVMKQMNNDHTLLDYTIQQLFIRPNVLEKWRWRSTGNIERIFELDRYTAINYVKFRAVRSDIRHMTEQIDHIKVKQEETKRSLDQLRKTCHGPAQHKFLQELQYTLRDTMQLARQLKEWYEGQQSMATGADPNTGSNVKLKTGVMRQLPTINIDSASEQQHADAWQQYLSDIKVIGQPAQSDQGSLTIDPEPSSPSSVSSMTTNVGSVSEALDDLKDLQSTVQRDMDALLQDKEENQEQTVDHLSTVSDDPTKPLQPKKASYVCPRDKRKVDIVLDVSLVSNERDEPPTPYTAPSQLFPQNSSVPKVSTMTPDESIPHSVKESLTPQVIGEKRIHHVDNNEEASVSKKPYIFGQKPEGVKTPIAIPKNAFGTGLQPKMGTSMLSPPDSPTRTPEPGAEFLLPPKAHSTMKPGKAYKPWEIDMGVPLDGYTEKNRASPIPNGKRIVSQSSTKDGDFTITLVEEVPREHSPPISPVPVSPSWKPDQVNDLKVDVQESGFKTTSAPSTPPAPSSPKPPPPSIPPKPTPQPTANPPTPTPSAPPTPSAQAQSVQQDYDPEYAITPHTAKRPFDPEYAISPNTAKRPLVLYTPQELMDERLSFIKHASKCPTHQKLVGKPEEISIYLDEQPDINGSFLKQLGPDYPKKLTKNSRKFWDNVTMPIISTDPKMKQYPINLHDVFAAYTFDKVLPPRHAVDTDIRNKKYYISGLTALFVSIDLKEDLPVLMEDNVSCSGMRYAVRLGTQIKALRIYQMMEVAHGSQTIYLPIYFVRTPEHLVEEFAPIFSPQDPFTVLGKPVRVLPLITRTANPVERQTEGLIERNQLAMFHRKFLNEQGSKITQNCGYGIDQQIALLTSVIRAAKPAILDRINSSTEWTVL